VDAAGAGTGVPAETVVPHPHPDDSPAVDSAADSSVVDPGVDGVVMAWLLPWRVDRVDGVDRADGMDGMDRADGMDGMDGWRVRRV
jgi:hypothetical protein